MARGSLTFPERVRYTRERSESPLVRKMQRTAQSRPRIPAASTPTAKKSGTAMSGRRVAAETSSASLRRFTVRGLYNARTLVSVGQIAEAVERIAPLITPGRRVGQLRTASRRPEDTSGPGPSRAVAAARGLRGGRGERDGFPAPPPPPYLRSTQVYSHLILSWGPPDEGHQQRSRGLRCTHELRRRPRRCVCRPGKGARPPRPAARTVAEGNPAKARGLRS